MSDSATVVVVTGAGGGTVLSGDVQLVFPAGAIDRPLQVVVNAATGAPSDPALVVGSAYEFTPDGLAFAAPVDLTIRYDVADIPSGFSETQLGINHLVQGKWERLAGTRVDVAAHEVTAAISGFSVYAVLGRSAATVEVSPKSVDLAVAETVQLEIVAVTSTGDTIPDPVVAWVSDDVNVATVSSTGLVTTVAVGTATVTATTDGVQGTATINVNPGPSISLSPDLLTFAATADGGDPVVQTVDVTAGGASAIPLTDLALGTITYSGPAAGWLGTASLSGTTAPATLTVQPTTGTLAPGTYVATVPIMSPVAANSPRMLSVAFTVNPRPTIVVVPDSPGFSAVEGGADPLPQTVDITNGAAGPVLLSDLAVGTIAYGPGAAGWLGSATLSGTTAPAVLTLQPLTGSLLPGTYTATVPITSSVAGNSPQNVNVTFTVGALAPTIALNPTARAFTAVEGGADPTALTVAVDNAGGGSTPLTALVVGTIVYTGGASGWLTTVTLSGTTAPATLTLQPETGSLTPGTYTATVPIESSVASNSPQTVTVTFTVNPQPTIVLTPMSVTFTATEGAASPTAQTVDVTDGIGGPVPLTDLALGTVTYGSGASGWLTGAALNGTTAPAVLTLQPATTGLAPGTYTATVPVTSIAAANSPQDVAVTFTVNPKPTIAVSSANPGFSATENGPNPNSQTIDITNGTTTPVPLTNLTIGTVSYGAGASGWLGTPLLSGPDAPAQLTLQPQTAGLLPGTYTATVPVESSVASNSPTDITVTFTIGALVPTIALNPTARTFTAVENGSDPAALTVDIVNAGGGSTPLSGLSIGTIVYGAGASGWLTTTTLSGTTAPATLTLQPATGSLVPGTYTATVPIQSSVAPNSPQNVTVTFNVLPVPPSIVLTPTSRTFTATENGADPAALTVAIANGSGGSTPLSNLAVGTITYGAGASGWLTTATVNPTTAPATLTLQPTTGTLAPGTYTATVPVESSVASNNPQNVTVTFTVNALPPTIRLTPTSRTFTATENGTDPAALTVDIANGSGGSTPLTDLSIGAVTYGVGATGWLKTPTLNSTTAPATLTLQPSITGLSPGPTRPPSRFYRRLRLTARRMCR
jgi:hypothetical protein